MKINLNKNVFLNYFLSSLCGVTNEGSIYIHDNRIVGIAVGEQSTPVLYCKIQQTNDIGDAEFVKLNFKNLQKLLSAIKAIPEDDFTLNINKECTVISYKNIGYSFRMHNGLDSTIKRCPINEKKINEIETDFEIEISRDNMHGLGKLSAFSTDANKIYFYVKDGGLYADLTDKALTDEDCASMLIKEDVEDLTFDEIPFDFSIVKNICKYKVENIKFRVNNKFKILFFEIETDVCNIIYLVSAFVK